MLVSQAIVAVASLLALFYFFSALSRIAKPYAPIVWVALVVQIATGLIYASVIFQHGGLTHGATLSLDTRYVFWLLTTPFLVAIFPLFLRTHGVASSLVTRLVLADICMLAAGYVGESAMASSGASLNWTSLLAFGVGLMFFVYLLFEILTNIDLVANNQNTALYRGILALAVFLGIGWSIYPIAYILNMIIGTAAIGEISELIYVMGDLVNKLLLSVLAVALALRLSELGEVGDEQEQLWGDASPEEAALG